MAELLYVVLALVIWLGPAAFAIFLTRRPLLARLEGLEREFRALSRKVDRLTARETPEALPPIVPTVQAETIPAPPSASPDASRPIFPKSTPSHEPAPLPRVKPAQPALPDLPPTPSVMQRVVDAVNLDESPVVRWFVGVHLLVRVAVIVLFFGVGFLLKYVVDQGWMTVEMRLLGATLLGVGMMAVGWRVRQARRIYGLTLQGGGFGIVYMTIFAAFRLYGLLPAPMAFGLMVTLVALGGGLAVLNNAMSVAILALAGGFAAPFLTSSGAGSHVTLFSYYLILNVGILGIAWFKAWRPLNLLAFLFTLGLGAFWGVEAYQPTFFATTEPFLITFALFFVGVSLLFARHFPDGADTVDTVMVFGTPVAFLGLQSTLVGDIPYGMANSTLAVGLFYLLLAGVIFMRRVESFRILREFFLLFGIIGLSLTVPLRFDDQWTSGIWALEGAGLVWSGVRRKQPLGWLVGILLQVGAAVFWWTYVDFHGWGAGWVDAVFVGSVLISLGGLISAYAIRAQAPSDTVRISAGDVNVISIALGLWGLGWWFGGGSIWVLFHGELIQWSALLAIFLTFSILAGEELGRRLKWTLMRLPFLGLSPMLAILAFIHVYLPASVKERSHWIEWSGGWLLYHPLAGLGLLAWPLGIAVYYYVLHRQDDRPWAGFFHGAGLWLVAFLAGLEGWWLIAWGLGRTAADNAVWISLGLLGPATLILLGVGVLAWRRVRLIQCRPGAYLLLGSVPLVALLGMWSFLINLSHSGDPKIFRYLPLLNPLDLFLVLILVSLGVWLSQLARTYSTPTLIKMGWFGLIGLGFLGFNAMLARTAHHLLGVEFRFDALLDAAVLQATYAITWSAIALVLMFWATGRGKRRGAWMVGAALLALTVVKLFLVDLGQAETIPRIISFLGVGLLMLVIGYFAPAPPAEAKTPPPSLPQVGGGAGSP